MKKIFLVWVCCLLFTGPALAAGYTRSVAIVLYQGVELLDFAGPTEVFAAAAGFGRAGAPGGAPAFKVFTVAATHDVILSQRLIKVTPDYSIDDAPPADVIVIPGGDSAAVTSNAAMMRWVGERTRTTQINMSVCTGAMVLAKAGLLDGRDATTHFGAIATLRQLAPRTRVHDGRRLIDNGNVVTTAGVSAGIDGALHVVARLLGRRVADQTARYMEYAWHPDAYLAETYETWNPSLDARGRALQQASALGEERRWDEAAAGLRRLLAERPDDAELGYELARVLQGGGHVDDAIPLYKRAALVPATRAGALYNLGTVYALKKQRAEALDSLEASVAAGFDAFGWMSVDPDLAGLHGDPRFERLAARRR